jgi:hypothetical protein
MSIERTYAGHQTRYELRHQGGLSCVLIYTAERDAIAVWKILLPGPGGIEDLYGTRQLPDPDSAQIRAWLTPIVGADHAAELASAVDSAPPPPATWQPGR